jgi:hypothetical protein
VKRFCALLLASVASVALAQAPDSRFTAGGYYRLSARPDFQGGNGRLGFWNISGRLLNEGNYAALEMKLDLLQAPPGTTDIWASLHARLEGDSLFAADANNGSFGRFRMSQLYARAGNILAPNVIWQLGTQQFFFGDLGLYDLRPAQLFDDLIGISARWLTERLDVLVAFGDSGFALRGLQYAPIVTAGAAARVHVTDNFEFGGGAQVSIEPFIVGNRFSSYVTPTVRTEDFLRKEVLRRYLEENPGRIDQFPRPQAPGQTSLSWRAVGYIGFGGFGPLRWNNLFGRYSRLHPQNFYSDSFNGQAVTVYTADLTRDRYSLLVGDEAQLQIIPDRLDLVLAGLFGMDRDYKDTIQASEANRLYGSGVARAQVYITPVVHILVEGSLAYEQSLQGNLFRGSFDSIFRSTQGLPDTRGLEFGDQSTRTTVQAKAGVVLNPTGRGIYSRPSIRLLYGLQYSTMHAAFGNAFAERIDQFNVMSPVATIAWHHLLSLESEGWF